MVFSSVVFLFLFLPVTLAGYYLINEKFRNVFLLLMSVLFYAVGEPSFVFVMLLSIAANYGIGLLMWKTLDSKAVIRRLILVLGVLVNLGILFYYKYYDFTVSNINGLFGTSIALRNIALPIGISFFTFQGMSYTLDVYMKKASVQKNPLNVALYIALFPQLVAGPIVRYSDINEQIDCRRETLALFATGIYRFTFGLAKKVILSNTFATLADTAFKMEPEALSVGMAWLGAIGYSLQIYFDFSGYSDMAIGLGRMFGFRFNENFDHPYIATGITDFWKRWHISLSTWFRDYIYIPLGGNRKGNVYFNIFVVFLVTGIWHGASWNFVVWGLWHGFFRLLELFLQKRNIKLGVPKPIKWIYTMLVVIVGWVLFRAPTLSSAVSYLKCMLGMGGVNANVESTLFHLLENLVILIIGCVCTLPVVKWIKGLCEKHSRLELAKELCLPVVNVVLMIVSVSLLLVTENNPFIYFNF